LEYTPQSDLNPVSLTPGNLLLYDTDTEEIIPISEVVYIPEENIIQIMSTFGELKAQPYQLEGNNISDLSNETITVNGFAYPVKYNEPNVDTVTVVSTSYFNGEQLIYDIHNVSGLTVQFMVVNTSNTDYEALPYAICINNDPNRVIASGTMSIEKDSKIKVSVPLGNVVLQGNEKLTMKIG